MYFLENQQHIKCGEEVVKKTLEASDKLGCIQQMKGMQGMRRFKP